MGGLELRSLALLIGGHPSLSPELRVGKAIEEMGVGADGDMEVGRVILAELERFEAVDDQWFCHRVFGPVLMLKEETVSPESGDLVADGHGCNMEVAGDLAVSGAGDDEGEELAVDIGSFEPVGGGKGLGAEGTGAMQALEPLNLLGLDLAGEEPHLLEGPSDWVGVEATAWVRAVGWLEGCTKDRHTHSVRQGAGQKHSSRHNQFAWTAWDGSLDYLLVPGRVSPGQTRFEARES